MTCGQLTDFIIDYRSGVLRPDVRAEFDAHLGECSECVTYLESYEDTIALARGVLGAPEDLVPPNVPEKLVQAILAARGKRGG
jgi:anti-sigma factor RsiW